MRRKRALLPLVFFLFLLLPATNIDKIICSEKLEPSAGNLPGDRTEGEINLNDNREYRDGLIDNFDNFINPGYPSGNSRLLGTHGVDKYVL